MHRERSFSPPPGDGSFQVGVDAEGKPVCMSASDALRHVLVAGDVAGACEPVVLSLVESAIANGGGAIYVTGMGDVASFARIHAAAQRYGREDDVLVLNFMTGNSNWEPSIREAQSNTYNPFANGSADALAEMVLQLMDESGNDGSMWKARATSFFQPLMRSLTWMRAERNFRLDVGTIRDHLSLKSIVDLAYGDTYADLPSSYRKSLRSYLTSLPGFEEGKGCVQAQVTLDQHGYLDMQFTKILGNLADIYGHVFRPPSPDVDMADVIGNGRLLVVMLPVLEKSADELKAISGIVAHLVREGMRSRLGNGIESSWKEAVDIRSAANANPFLVVLDEVGYQTLDSLSDLTGQARSLGFGMVVATSGEHEIRRKTDVLEGFSTSILTERGDESIGFVGPEGKGRRAFGRGSPPPAERIWLRPGSDLTWSAGRSRRFHTRSARHLEFLREIAEDCGRAFSPEPLVLADALASLPVGPARTMIQQSFALVGGYRKIAALRDQATDPLADLYHLGGDHP